MRTYVSRGAVWAPGTVLAMGGLHHVEINVADLERSVEFWGWLLPELGYELYQEWAEGKTQT